MISGYNYSERKKYDEFLPKPNVFFTTIRQTVLKKRKNKYEFSPIKVLIKLTQIMACTKGVEVYLYTKAAISTSATCKYTPNGKIVAKNHIKRNPSAKPTDF